MNIDYVSTVDSQDVLSWSGAAYYMAKALENQGAAIHFIKNDPKPKSLVDKIKAKAYSKLSGKSYERERTIASALRYAELTHCALSPECDIVFSPGTLPIAFLKTNKPKVFFTDATFAGMLGFYDAFSHLSERTIKEGNAIEQAAFDSCALAIFASEWAAETALAHYKVNPDKVKVVPFGANIECHRSYEDIERMIDSRSTDICKLFFIGVDWERKGGPIAVETARVLNEAGLKTELHVAGIRSFPGGQTPENVIDHGFISKSTAEGQHKLDALMAQSHFMILPTRAEAYGLVYCEANSFGIPSIGTQVGGVPTIVKDGLNGKAFPLSAGGKEYADYISQLFHNYPSYRQLALSSFNEYKKRLNWEVAGKSLINLLNGL